MVHCVVGLHIEHDFIIQYSLLSLLAVYEVDGLRK